MLDTACPKCGSDQTQSFAMAHKSGTSSGFAVGVGMTGDRDVGLGSGFSRQQTGIAKLTQPPKKESGTGESIALIFIAVVIFNFVGVAAAWLFSLVSGSQFESVSVWIAGMLVGLIAAIAFGIWAWKRTGGQKNRLEAAYKAALMKWEHSWICLRCGSTYYVR